MIEVRGLGKSSGATPVLSGLAAVLLLLAPASCARQQASDAPPVVLLFSIDTLRADAVPETTTIAELGRRGRSFATTWASSNWTLPTHTSLLTSRPFLEHQVPPPVVEPPFQGYGIEGTTPTLATALTEAGYFAAASTEGGYVDRGYGFENGFASYVQHPHAHRARRRIAAHVSSVRQLIGRAGDRPTFLFIHSYLTHDYFRNDADYRVAEGFDPELTARGSLIGDLYEPAGAGIPEDYLRAVYRRGVEWGDRLVAAVIEAVESSAPGRPLHVILTSDHGESFGEPSLTRGRALWHHGTGPTLGQLLVPLIYWSSLPGSPDDTIDFPVSTIDVAPSILDRLGIEPPADFRGRRDLLGAEIPSPGRGTASPVLARDYLRRASPRPFGINQLIVADDRVYIRTDDVTGATTLERCLGLPAPSHDPAAPRFETLTEAAGADCLPLRDRLAGLLPERTGGSVIVRSAGPVKLTMPDDRTTALLSVTRVWPRPEPVWDGSSPVLEWSPAGPRDALVLTLRDTSFQLAGLWVSGTHVAGPLHLEVPTAGATRTTVLEGGAAGGGVTLLLRGRSGSPRRTAESEQALMERLRTLGYVR